MWVTILLMEMNDHYSALQAFAEQHWEEEIIPELTEYIRIPCKSPLFDPDWEQHGYLDQAMAQFVQWIKKQSITGLHHEVVRLPGRTPLLYVEIAGSIEQTILLYGHLDKQPEMSGWRSDLGPWTPKREQDRLYGRGGADDGYALFASVSAIAALQQQQIPHARCVILIEASEESGSPDLPAYMQELLPRIGDPALVICLDSGCGDYQRLWYSTSLRGMLIGTLTVEVMQEGVHSGDAGGVVACSFRIVRELLSRIEDSTSGEILLQSCRVEIPAARQVEAKQAAQALGELTWTRYPLLDAVDAVSDDATELLLNRTWRPCLAVTGADGLPATQDAGNVLRPGSSVKLTLRLPPTCAAAAAMEELSAVLQADPPHAAQVTFTPHCAADGWHCPPLSEWLQDALQMASETTFGNAAVAAGDGVTIPFMNMLVEVFPQTQFLVTGGTRAGIQCPRSE